MLEPDPMLELRNISKSFGAGPVLDSLSLHVRAGEVTALIGPSGCGKSTLLRLAVGLIRPDRGTIHVAGGTIDRTTPKDSPDLLELRRRMGYVIQSGGLFPHMTARGNVGLLPAHLGWPEDRIAARAEELAELAHLDPRLLDRYPLQLSGGQRQRISLMRALMLDPDILLLDEPLGALDPMIRSDLQKDLREIFRRLRKTVVLVTHDLLEAGYFSRRIVVLDRGSIVQEGSYEDLRDRPADPMVRRFLAAQRSERDVLKGETGDPPSPSNGAAAGESTP